jgi:hypothetical protein
VLIFSHIREALDAALAEELAAALRSRMLRATPVPRDRALVSSFVLIVTPKSVKRRCREIRWILKPSPVGRPRSVFKARFTSTTSSLQE